MEEDNEVETDLQLFDLLPKDLEIIILSFVLFGSETGKRTEEEEGEKNETNKNDDPN